MTSRDNPPTVKRLLLVDDTDEDRALVRRMLRKGATGEISLHEADSVAAALDVLGDAEVDCILLDHNLPDGFGVDVLAEIRRRQGVVPSAAVYLTNAGVEAAAVAALQAGAQDFVSKDGLTPEGIWRAVDNAVERVRMTRELAESERRLRSLSADLERRVERRTEDLQKALDELSGFTYSISHDLRTPIRAIVSSSRILIEDYGHELSPAARAELDRQATAGQKLGDLVDDLLRYARLGGERIGRVPVNLSEIARCVAATLSEQETYAADAHFRIESGLRAIADPAMLEILLTILFDNATKYRRANAACHVAFEFDGEAFCVHDDGIGFDMRFLDKLFRPFERLHRDGEYPGTGIGLANAKRIVERHDGRLWAESSPGEGATFRFKLGDQPTG